MIYGQPCLHYCWVIFMFVMISVSRNGKQSSNPSICKSLLYHNSVTNIRWVYYNYTFYGVVYDGLFGWPESSILANNLQHPEKNNIEKGFGSEVIIPPPCLSNLVNNGILPGLSFFISKIKIINSQYYRGYYIMCNIISEHKLNVVNISLDNGGKFHLFNCEKIVRK